MKIIRALIYSGVAVLAVALLLRQQIGISGNRVSIHSEMKNSYPYISFSSHVSLDHIKQNNTQRKLLNLDTNNTPRHAMLIADAFLLTV